MVLRVVVLAAGQGKRMGSDLPKVMHTVGGVPMLERVVDTAAQLNPAEIFVVTGSGADTIQQYMKYLPVTWVEQKEQLGTGHAVAQVLSHCHEPDDQLLVLYGDVPLITADTLKHLLQNAPPRGLGIVVTELADPTGFGRIIRDEMSSITAIVEHRDANAEQRRIGEINTGIMTTTVTHLQEWLPRVQTSNQQKEYYLTDVVSLAVADGVPVGGVHAFCHEEVMGVNDKWQLANAERYYQQQIAKTLAMQGVTLRDPNTLTVRRPKLSINPDVVLDVNVILQGTVIIGSGSVIGPHTILRDVEIGSGVMVEAFSMIEESVLEDGAMVGPFSRIRPGSRVKTDARVGNFVELKNCELGAGSKANHLSYLGDCVVGKQVNIGAGTITCNYDGVNKHRTTIGDHAFIGSHTALVAPIHVGAYATIGAGSVLTHDAPDHALTLSRIPQKTLANWERPLKVASKLKKTDT